MEAEIEEIDEAGDDLEHGGKPDGKRGVPS
jgi:hypothetical protein